ncbi:MAG: DUF885 domain-containing protein [Chloroflexi bacterium]|nr:MAG: DUF885 domain-containing protein [Chloroflexota bacterium]
MHPCAPHGDLPPAGRSTVTATSNAFADRVATFFDEYFRLDPVSASSIGDHRFDDRWPDMTDAGRAERLAFAERWIAELRGLDVSVLSGDELADRDVLLLELDAARFREEELGEDRWDPLNWVYLMGGGFFPLLAREFAPLATRLSSATGRMERLPALLDAARSQIVGHGDRPVSRFHAETALKQLPGIEELVGEAVTAGESATDDAARADPEVAALLPRLHAAAETARAALSSFGDHLRDTVIPAAQGEGRLGPDLFAAKLRHTLRIDLTPDEVLERAEREYAAVRSEMIRLARQSWTVWKPDRPLPTAASAGSEAAAETETVRAVLDAIAAQHQKPEDLLDFCRAELGRIEAFCRERNVLGMADEPLQIMWTPVFLRAFGGAMLDSPGPLDKAEKAFFCVTPIPEDWTPEQVESYLREDNDRMLRLLTIHEAVPGHYLQGVHANRCPSLPRTILWSGVFAEGWAVYVTQVMMDLGYGADDKGLMLNHWKFYLRACTNAIIDVKIHAGSMTEDEAVQLMVEGGFQEEAEARNKWNRARLSSTQLSTYFIGSVAFWDIEVEARRRAAAASRDPRGASAVPTQRVVGGLGETPGFVYRDHLESVMSHGSPPMPILRRLLFD